VAIFVVEVEAIAVCSIGVSATTPKGRSRVLWRFHASRIRVRTSCTCGFPASSSGIILCASIFAIACSGSESVTTSGASSLDAQVLEVTQRDASTEELDGSAPTPEASAGNVDAAAEMDASIALDAATADASMPDTALPIPPPADTCTTHDQCESNRVCIGGVCTLNPAGLGFVETEYTLVQPEALAQLVETAKTSLGGTKLLAMAFPPNSNADLSLNVTYGAADPSDPGYEMQEAIHERRTFVARRYDDPRESQQGNTWASDPFVYTLHARTKVLSQDVVIGFSAQDVVAVAQFDESLEKITAGSLEGALTRSEAEQRALSVPSLLCPTVCPASYCINHTISRLADILDCNEVPQDVDLDHATPGNDAYAVRVRFRSERAELK